MSQPSSSRSAGARRWPERFGSRFARVWTVIDHALDYASAAVLFGMMLLTLVDVIGREWLNSPVPGAFEITEMMLAAIIFIGLPRVCETGGHVSVGLISDQLPARARRTLARVMHGVGAVLLATLAWLMALKALDLTEPGTRERTEYLGIPLYPAAWLILVFLVIAAAVEAVRVFVLRQTQAVSVVEEAVLEQASSAQTAPATPKSF